MIKTLCLALPFLMLGACKENGGDTAKKVGSKVGESLSEFSSGIGEGIDKKMTIEVELTEAILEKNLTHTIAKSQGLGSNGISVYLISKDAVKGSLVTKALNEEGLEIGRSTVEIDFDEDDAKYVDFDFDRTMDLQLAKSFKIDLKD